MGAVAILLWGLTAWPGPASASGRQAADATAALRELRVADRRVLATGWRLSHAAAELCPDARPGLGWALHALPQYRPGLREAVAREFHLPPGRMGVMAVAPDGPAARAGVIENDVLLSVNGRSVVVEQTDGPADYASLAAALDGIEARTGDGPLDVQILRGGRTVALTVQPQRQCPWSVQVEPSPHISARADGRRIAISTGLVARTHTDHELAFVLAHEMAHNLRRPDPKGPGARSRAREAEADRIGLILAGRAGYETAGVGEFVRRLGREAGWRPPWFDDHPTPRRRAEALDREHARIEALRQEGLPLTP